MDYIGSKEKLNDWIYSIAQTIVSNGTLLDACSGSGAVSRYMAKAGYKVVACDCLDFPRHLSQGSIGVEEHTELAKCHIDKINQLEGIEGFFYNNYSEKSGRIYFTDENAKRIDSCRQYIEELPRELDRLRSLLIYCGIEALSRVANTAGTHGAFLKKFKQRSLQPFQLRLEETVSGNVTAHCSDILELLKSSWVDYDIVYIDPPYTSRQYAPNYHLYETFSRYDCPKIKGITGIRAEWQKDASKFCKKKLACEFFKDVVAACRAPVLISYSTDGLLSVEEMERIFAGELGKTMVVHRKEWRRYKADNNRTYRDDKLEELLIQLT